MLPPPLPPGPITIEIWPRRRFFFTHADGRNAPRATTNDPQPSNTAGVLYEREDCTLQKHKCIKRRFPEGLHIPEESRFK